MQLARLAIEADKAHARLAQHLANLSSAARRGGETG